MGVCVDELSRELRPPLTAEAALVEADRCLECGGAARARAVRRRLPGERRRPGLRRGHRRGRSRDGRTDHLRRERPRRDLRARLPGRGALPAGLRPDPRGTAADRDRRAPALRDRVGIRERRAAAPGGRRERQARRRRGRRPGRARCGRRARCARLRRDRLRRACGGRRARPLRDRAVSADERAAARRSTAARRARSGVPPRHASGLGAPARARCRGRRDRARSGNGRGPRRDVRGRPPRRRLGVAAVHRETEDRTAAGRR